MSSPAEENAHPAVSAASIWNDSPLEPEEWRTWCISKPPAFEACARALRKTILALRAGAISLESVRRRIYRPWYHPARSINLVRVPIGAFFDVDWNKFLEPRPGQLRRTYQIIEKLREIRNIKEERGQPQASENNQPSENGASRDSSEKTPEASGLPTNGEAAEEPTGERATTHEPDQIYPKHLSLPSKDEAEDLLFLAYVRRYRPEKSWREIAEMLGRSRSYCSRKCDELGLR